MSRPCRDEFLKEKLSLTEVIYLFPVVVGWPRRESAKSLLGVYSCSPGGCLLNETKQGTMCRVLWKE